MGIFNFLKKKDENTKPPTEPVKKVYSEKTVSEVFNFINVRDFEELIKLACDAALMSDYYEDILKLVKPAILLLSEKNDTIDTLTGISKIGGNPDLPKDFIWPKNMGHHLSFLLQINCNDLPGNSGNGFPDQGILSFFYCFSNELENTALNNIGFGKVFHFMDKDLSKVECPKQTVLFDPCKITFVKYPSLPYLYDYYSTILWDLDFLEEEIEEDEKSHEDEMLSDRYNSIFLNLEKITGISYVAHHQLFGYPESVKGPNIEVEISKAKHEIQKSINEFSKDELEKVYNQQLILQINEDKDAGIKLIDNGKIYYVGDKSNQQILDNVWSMLDFG